MVSYPQWRGLRSILNCSMEIYEDCDRNLLSSHWTFVHFNHKRKQTKLVKFALSMFPEFNIESGLSVWECSKYKKENNWWHLDFTVDLRLHPPFQSPLRLPLKKDKFSELWNYVHFLKKSAKENEGYRDIWVILACKIASQMDETL